MRVEAGRIERGTFVSDRLRELYDYWAARCAAGRPMPRAALDPVDLAPLLPNLMMLEVPADGGELRFRLAGDEIEDRYGRSLRGRRLSETFQMVRRRDTSHQWTEIVADGRPKYRRGPMAFPGDRVFEAERLLLPLSDEARPVSHILGAVYYLPLPASAFEATAVSGSL